MLPARSPSSAERGESSSRTRRKGGLGPRLPAASSRCRLWRAFFFAGVGGISNSCLTRFGNWQSSGPAADGKAWSQDRFWSGNYGPSLLCQETNEGFLKDIEVGAEITRSSRVHKPTTGDYADLVAQTADCTLFRRRAWIFRLRPGQLPGARGYDAWALCPPCA